MAIKKILGKTTGATKKTPTARKSKAAISQAKDASDPGQRLIVHGTVSYRDTSPAIGLTVTAFDKDIGGEDRLGQATTDAIGGYRITYSEAEFRRSPNESRGADIFVRIHGANDVLLFQSKTMPNAPADFLLDVKLAGETFVVRGQIRLADGTPVAGALVRAYDKDLRTKEPLGKSKPVATDTEGRYEIIYTAEQFSRVEKSNADLLVEARQNAEAKWIAEPIRFNAQPVEVVDITLDGVYRGPTEFRRLVDELTPLLDGLTMAQLTENSEYQDITFLSNESGVDRQLIALLAISALRAQEEDVLLQEEYYGLFRQNLPTDLGALLGQATDALRAALDKSARDNIIRPMFEQDLNDFVARVLQLKAGRVLRPGGVNAPASLGDLLDVAVNAEKHQVVAKYFVEHGGETDAFWKALEEDGGLKPDEVKAVKQTLALDTFTDKHLPLVRELYQMGQGTAAFTELRGFAQLDETQWQDVLQRPREPGGTNSKPIGFPPGQESIESYARTLNQFIETTFPTAVIANRLGRDISDESPFKEAKSDLLVFFSNNPEFSFTDTSPDLYLRDEAGKKLRDIKDPAVLGAQLKSMKRVFNITPRFPEIRALLADDLHSATAMVYFGERRFTEKYAEPLGGISKAREAYKKAEHVHATALNVYMKHAEAFNSPTPYVISGGERVMADPQTGVDRSRLSAFRTRNSANAVDLRNLFGSLDLCDCEHCLSLYSPAAYFVDILKFLRDGPVNADGLSPLQILLARRPDIGHIELTCENTNTQLPYVDLVNEVLEEALIPSPIGHWEFDEGQGKTALDASANGNNGKLQALSGSGPIWETGKIGTNSLSFDGTYDYVQIPAKVGQRLSDTGSICAWIYPKGVGSLSPRGTIIAKEGEFIISWQLSSNGGAIDWRFPNRQPSEQWHAAGGFIAPVNKWTHIAVVFDKGKVKTYANGLLVDDASGTGSIGLASSQHGEITIGGRPGVPQYFYGLIDDVRLYDGALNEEGVRTSAQARPRRQTRGTAEELAANPEYINTSAYESLSKAVYPWSLPLNLPLEEVRTYLGHLGVQRHEMMETLFVGEASEAVSDNDIALEYLGLTKKEADIIAGVTTGGPVSTPSSAGAWNFWGLSDAGNDIVDRINGAEPHAQGDWDVVLQRVSIFLQQSGLTYKELLELLGTYFINPLASAGTPGGRLLGIVSAEGELVNTCNLSKLEIQVVDDTINLGPNNELIAAWNRIHRFVRLWRKLGWTMRDLDKAITALKPGINNGRLDTTAVEAEKNVDFLIQLSHIQRLHLETNLPVVNLLAWYADIDTRSYVDQLADGEPTVVSLYAQLFSNKTVSGQLVGENPAALRGTLSGKAAAIAAALQISVEGFTLLHADVNVIPRIRTPAGAGAIQDDRLTVVNLSRLYRHAKLAKALKLPIRTYLTTLALVNSAPFATTGSTIQFIKHIDKIRASGFSIEDLDYLLRNKFSATSDMPVADDVIATVLDAMRDDLRKVAAENTFVADELDDNAATSDPNGELTRKKLASLNWDSALVENVIAVLNGTFTYQATLTSLAPTVVFPESLKSRISYTEKKLRFTGTMTVVEQALLAALPNTDMLFLAAVGELFRGPKDFVKRYMARFSAPVFSVPVTDANLKSLLATFKFPDALKNKIYYDTVLGTLNFVGVMTEAERNVLLKLLKLSSNAEYLTDIPKLFVAPEASTPQGADIFLTSADAAILFGIADDNPQARFLLLLKQLLPTLKTTLSEIVVKQRLAEYLKLDATAINGLLKKWVKSQGDPQQKAMADFLEPVFAESSPNIGSSKDAFPRQFNSYLLLSKIAILVLKFNMTPGQLRWLFDSKLNTGWLDLNALPLGATAPKSSLFPGWERVADLFQLRDALPRGEVLLIDIFTAATAPGAQTASDAQKKLDKVLEILSKGTQWELGSLKSLSGKNGFNVEVKDFAGESTILRLSVAFAMLKRLGASANQCRSWAEPSPTSDDARELKSVLRAKYDAAQWLELAKALRDPLRERQRSALVAYLVQKVGVRDANELYDDFLIDVEMSPCMMTTRIKQAISSVQLFIQRSLMNLEKPDVSLTPDDAKEWSQWRKWYRVWEANRKVLFYPENWIEPELRDDKSPFYKDLESELLQSDVTMATAEDTFLHYLEKLDQVARLEIVGMYHQREYLPGNLQPEIDILHVFGRTYATAHIYFYRRLEDKVWSAWEKVDLDIEGDHLIPIAWNRRLYLFWAIFTEKSEQPTKDQREKDEDPIKNWEIKLVWSEYKNKSWSPKKISKQLLRHEKNPAPVDPKDTYYIPQEPQDFSFKTRILQGPAGEQLSIECYGTSVTKGTSKQVIVTPRQEAVNVNEQSLVTLPPNPSDPLPTFIRVGFFKNGVLPLPDEDLGVSVKFKYSDGSRWSPFLNDKWSGLIAVPVGNGLLKPFFSVSKQVDCYLVSTKYQGVARVPQYVQNEGSTIVAVNVDLTSWSPIPEVKAVEKTVHEPPKNNPMQGIGEFTLEDCNGDLAAVPVANVVGGMSPAELASSPGTKIQSMQFVDTSNEQALKLRLQPPYPPRLILSATPGTFRLLTAHQFHVFDAGLPFFFQDDLRTYFVSWPEDYIHFTTFFHPHVCDFIKALNREGIHGLLTLQNQLRAYSGQTFSTRYRPNEGWMYSAPKEDVDFELEGANSLYNWELFFHTPFLIAMQLSKNQRFEEAQKWFHYIFDPTATDSPGRPGDPGIERFWRVKPFYQESIRDIQTLEELIADSTNLEAQVAKWEADPFKPHVIARMRVVAYMKAVVMRYIDNLIAWGDQLFRRDTLESINEATQLYILAAQILGRRPENIPVRVKAKIQTFRTLNDVATLDSLSNAMVEIESFFAPSVAPAPVKGNGSAPPLRMQYFCITGNDKLLGYWDTVSDRLFKIRHCMNIEGVERSLPIFEPPIDPGLLVRAAAAGVDISSALNDINAAVPHYRFNVMVQKASELCNDVKALGGAFLSALEKRDAEALALLRSSHEVELLTAIRAIRAQQVEEAGNTLEGLRKYEDVVTTRQQYYLSRPFLNPFEKSHIDLTTGSLIPMGAQAGAGVLAAILYLIPDAKMGLPTTTGTTYGGSNIASAVNAFGSATGTIGSMLSTMASLSATQGSYQRRQDDWTHQADLATKELKQVKKQILAADIRLAIADNELLNHDLQIKNAKEVNEYMRHQKFTNQQLYSWMVGQLSGIYFQSYQLAYDVAKRAERTYRYELGLKDSNFIQFGYWDSLKKGLLSGERLYLDLKRMDAAYLDKNKREYEITKHVSLMQLDPMMLLLLRETGQCEMSLPEALLDMDFPGHYLRRIKSVSLTIPCVTGPYSSVPCTLTLLNHSVRHNSNSAGNYARSIENDDPRFTDSFGAIQSIVTSSAQNDSGMFETNLRDERYLPFEGAGVISSWRIELPSEFRQFNYDTISDVILHIRYTSREGGKLLKTSAVKNTEALVKSAAAAGSVRLFSVRHEFPTEWANFKNEQLNLNLTSKVFAKLTFELKPEHYPYWSHGSLNRVETADLFAETTNPGLKVSSQPDGTGEAAFEAFGRLKKLKKPSATNLPATPKEKITLYFNDKSMDNIWLALTWGK